MWVSIPLFALVLYAVRLIFSHVCKCPNVADGGAEIAEISRQIDMKGIVFQIEFRHGVGNQRLGSECWRFALLRKCFWKSNVS